MAIVWAVTSIVAGYGPLRKSAAVGGIMTGVPNGIDDAPRRNLGLRGSRRDDMVWVHADSQPFVSVALILYFIYFPVCNSHEPFS